MNSLKQGLMSLLMHIIAHFGVPTALYLIEMHSGSRKLIHMLGTLI